MNPTMSKASAIASLILGLAVACVVAGYAGAQTAQPDITLDPPTGWELQMHLYDSSGKALPEAPANFRRLGEATVGQLADAHLLTLRFAETTRLTGIKASSDFRIEQGGSCEAGNTYEKGTTCTVLMRFTPQGPGNRIGKLLVSYGGSATPLVFGVGGTAYVPVVSFVPALITTAPGTYPAKVGLLSGATNLSIDGGDILYAADTGNNAVRMLNSSGTWVNVGTSTITSPIGVGADLFGEVYASAGSAIYETYAYPYIWFQISGTGTDACHYPSTCTLEASSSSPSGESVVQPGAINFDSNNIMYFAEETAGAAFSQIFPASSSSQPSLTRVYDPFTYQTGKPTAFAYNNGYIYSWWPTTCQINSQPLYDAESFYTVFYKIAGGRICGFSGDGGLAGDADISNTPGQFGFDAAGNMYYTDSGNQRVRRIDTVDGIIRTIAGNGTAGYTGDGGASSSAELSYPTGVAVNSQGAVFVISGTGSTAGGAQVIRQIGPGGFRNFFNQLKGVTSAPLQTLVSNTGNSTLTMAGVQMVGANAADFTIDPGTTNCVFTAGWTLNAGQSCYVGIKFTPSAAGVRTGTLNLLDNSVPGINSVTLFGNGTLPVPTLAITSPANGSSFTSGTAVTFSAKVTSSSGPAPTGTVQFKVDGANFGSPVTLSSGAASTSVTGLTQTAHTLSATYSGDTNYSAAGPISVSITVTAVKVGSMVTLSQTVNAVGSCALPQFAANVSGKSGPVPTGQVQLLDAAAVIASGTLTNGEVILTPHSLAAGTQRLTASYAGDTNHLPAVSSVLLYVVAPTVPCTGPVQGAALHPPVRQP